MIILEPLERATVYLSAAQYPTIADIRFVFLGILEHLESIIGDDNFEQKELASSVNQKIGEYWNIINQQTLVSTVLDPRYKLSLFEVGASAAEAVSAVTSLLANYHHVTIPENRDVDESETPHQYFQRLKKRRLNYNETSRRSSIASSVSSVSNVSDELDRYLALQVDENVKPLLWWKAHEHEFPALAKISRDYLSIQATSVACEQAFSVAGNTITKTRNRLNPETARATLCAKSWIENGVVASLAALTLQKLLNPLLPDFVPSSTHRTPISAPSTVATGSPSSSTPNTASFPSQTRDEIQAINAKHLAIENKLDMLANSISGFIRLITSSSSSTNSASAADSK
ncbi:hypothetical protein RclHR1_06530002 [Rhizophagus clarus]|uniref:HAT C-terminal dimerisation domain-containing protein n=1 Tax=Rhizophagus clarus TaxID=94130 RepID=A0A2Z6SA88_9GLOM|nr:hypothetical protein RclHR1_06530002 [Rhizophagus clarus]